MLGLTATALTACSAKTSTTGQPSQGIYRIRSGQEAEVQFRMLDSVNSLRSNAGLTKVVFDGALNAAAATHSRDMSIQNRPWLFGSDGSSPLDRAHRVGFQGQLLGENISESYESELLTLTAWMAQSDTRAVIMDPNARVMGFSWFQEQTGKLWWTLNMGTDPSVTQQFQSSTF